MKGWLKMENKELYTLQETAEMLDLSYQTVLSIARKGYILAIKHGGQWRVNSTEIKRFKIDGNFEGEIDIVDVEEDTPIDIS